MKLELPTEAFTNAFDVLKNSDLSPPVLSFSKSWSTYSFETDASYIQIGAALFQTHADGVSNLVGLSRNLSAVKRNYSVSEKQFPTVVWELHILRGFLFGGHFVIHTDHSSLQWLMNVTNPSGRLIR